MWAKFHLNPNIFTWFNYNIISMITKCWTSCLVFSKLQAVMFIKNDSLRPATYRQFGITFHIKKKWIGVYIKCSNIILKSVPKISRFSKNTPFPIYNRSSQPSILMFFSLTITYSLILSKFNKLGAKNNYYKPLFQTT